MNPVIALPRWSAKDRDVEFERTGLRTLKITGLLTAVGYFGYFLLIQTHALWRSPSLVPDRWKSTFYPFIDLFPRDWIRTPRYDPLGLAAQFLYVLMLAALFGIYVVALRKAFSGSWFRAHDARAAAIWIFAVAAVGLLFLLLVPGVLSTDLFSYVWYGRIMVVFRDSPFTHVPADYIWADPHHWLQWVYWKETPSVYGPVWVVLAGLIAWVAQALGGDIVTHLLGHKILADLAHLLNIWLVWQVAGMVINRYWHRSQSAEGTTAAGDWRAGARIGATIAYAWNPLVLIEIGANGHNDVLMITGVLLALWFHLKGKWRFAILSFALAAMVKFIAVLFLPGYLWLLFWQAAPGGLLDRPLTRIWRVSQAVLILVGVTALAYVPFWEGPATIRPLLTGPPTELFVNSLGWLLKFKLADAVSTVATALGASSPDFWTFPAVAGRLDWPARWGPQIVFAVLAVLQTWKARTFPSMVVAWGWVLFAYLTVGAVWFWPWYVTWAVAVVALVGPGRLFNATILMSATSMLLYATYWPTAPWLRELFSWSPLVLVGPALVYATVGWWRASRVRGAAPVPLAPAQRPAPAVGGPAVRVPAMPTRGGLFEHLRSSALQPEIALVEPRQLDEQMSQEELDAPLQESKRER